jgi:ABC-type phosphate transport system auxiliary subunit
MQNNEFERFDIVQPMQSEEAGAVVVDLQAFRIKKAMIGDKRRGVQDTFDSSFDNSISGHSQMNRKDEELASRLDRIKSSIQRINQLMADLKDNNQPTKSL